MNQAFDEAVEAMRQANPVPDPIALAESMQGPEVFLASTKEMTMSLDTSQTTDPRPNVRPQRTRRRAVAIAAAFAVVAVSAAVVVSMSSRENIALAGAIDDPQAREAFSAVEAAYDTYNSGDDSWVEIRERSTSVETIDAAFDAHLRLVYAADQAAGSRYDVIGCRSFGQDTWNPSGEGDVIGHRFTCDAVLTDSFRGAANMSILESFEWIVADGEVVAVSSEGDFDPWWAYTSDFQSFMYAEHPEVAGDIAYLSWRGDMVVPAAESMALVLEYVDEFVGLRR
jgi:hypothetical protein